MANAALGTVLRHLHKLTDVSAAAERSDVELLHCFAAQRDEDAFCELLRRHGPLVLGVCRRILGHEQDAEDAFQAAFLVLARKAGSIRKGESVGSFLYGVAYRIAMKERTRLFQRRRREWRAEASAPTGPVYEAAFRELQAVLDGGLNQLPEKYRAPFVLCCLEGKSKGEAAHELGLREGTLSSRLAHARKALQRLLSRKGVTLTAGLAAVAVADNAARASVPPTWVAANVRAAVLFASGSSLLGREAGRAVQLAEAMLPGMAGLSWKASLFLLIACLVMGGAGLALSPQKALPPEVQKSSLVTPKGQQPAGERATVRHDRYGDPLPQGALARLGTTRLRHGLAITCRAVFSPDGKRIASAGSGRGVFLWDAATGRQLRNVGHDERLPVYTVAYSPDGKVLAFQEKSMPTLFDAESGAMLGPLTDAKPTENGVASLSFTRDGKALAVALFDAGIGVWDVDAGGRSRKRFENRQLDTRCVAFSPDGKVLASAGKDRLLHLWDATTGKELGQLKGHEKEVYAAAFSPDGRTLASAGQDDSVRLWDVPGRKLLRVLDSTILVWKGNNPGFVGIRARATLAFSPNGKLLATGHGDGTIILWDAGKGKEIRRWHAHCFTPASLDFSPDGKTLLSMAYWESGPRQWDVATGKELLPFAGHHAPVDQLTFSRDGKNLLSLGRDMVLLRWDLVSGRETVCFQNPPWALDGCRVSPGGDLLVSWEHGAGALQLRDAVTGKVLHTLGRFSGRKGYGFRLPLAFSSDGQLVAFGSEAEHKALVWNVADGKERLQIEGLKRGPFCVAFSPDGKRIALGASTRDRDVVALWSVTTAKELVTFPTRAPADDPVFSPDGKVLASSYWTGSAQLWDSETGHELRLLRSSTSLIALAFSPDGKWLAGAGGVDNQEIHVWEVNTGLKVRSYHGHVGMVLSVAFAPDGRSFATGGSDSTILLWDFTGRRKDGHWQTVKWTQAELEQRWNDLASKDGPKAVQAIWDLAASPEQTVALLRQRVKPAQPVDANRVQRWLRDLDSDDFPTRTAATRELEAVVDRVEPALRKELAENTELEARRRIERILQKLEPLASPERLRALRAVQVLEYAATPEARELLRALGQGAPGTRLTREAEAALGRLRQD